MFIAHTIRTSHGPRWLPSPAMVRVSVTPAELHSLAGTVERDARAAEAEGQHDLATNLYWRAAALREATR